MVATIEKPSVCCIERPNRRADKAKPRNRTTVSGATDFDLRGCSLVRLTATTRTEKGARLLASLDRVSVRFTFPSHSGSIVVWCSDNVGKRRVVVHRRLEARESVPNNVSNMIDVVPIVA